MLTWRGYVVRHQPGVTPAVFSAMVEGRDLLNRDQALAIALGIKLALSDKAESEKILKELGIEPVKASEEDREERRAAALKLLRKIEGSTARSEVITMGELIKRNAKGNNFMG